MPERISVGSIRDGLPLSRFPDKGSNPTKHQLLTPPPPPARPPPPKKVVNPNGGGDRGLKIEIFTGGHFVLQNNDFTRGQTCDIMPWGASRMTPKKGGVYGVCAYA